MANLQVPGKAEAGVSLLTRRAAARLAASCAAGGRAASTSSSFMLKESGALLVRMPLPGKNAPHGAAARAKGSQSHRVIALLCVRINTRAKEHTTHTPDAERGGGKGYEYSTRARQHAGNSLARSFMVQLWVCSQPGWIAWQDPAPPRPLLVHADRTA